jgi:bifunctional oligoribonuclease and PAP phosphatase NrnA
VSITTERDEIVEELRTADKLLLTTHENPDGDALGSLLAMHLILRQLGKDSLMFLAANNFPLPHEYRHMPLDEVMREPPPDMEDRTVLFLDCGNIDRMPVDFLQHAGVHRLNIDHHHDNTRFGSANLVVPDASSTAEIVYGLARELGAEITLPIAEALYIALVTDTGKFMFENTSPAAHQMAAELIEAGVEPQAMHQQLYEGLPFSRLQLLSRALAAIRRYDNGALTMTHLTKSDFADSGAVESDSEGIVDHLRAIEDTSVAVLVRELIDPSKEGLRKVSLRSTDGRVDVSHIARGLGGGGHTQAAGFTTELPVDDLVDRLRQEIREQL